MRRRASAALAAAVACGAAIAPAAASGAGATYEVVFCDVLNRDPGGVVESTTSYAARDRCSDQSSDTAFKLESVGFANARREATIHWEVADPLGFVGVQVEARLRRADGHRSRLFMADSQGRETVPVAAGQQSPDGFGAIRWQGTREERFVASLRCEDEPGCAQSEHAKTWLRGIRLTVADYADPEVEASGSVLDGGWVSGGKVLGIDGRDDGSGLQAVTASVNGAEVLAAPESCPGEIPGTDAANQLVPCQPSGTALTELQTAQAPWQTGSNAVLVCSSDFARNTTCLSEDVRVDNEAPSLSFADTQDPEDPELIRVDAIDEHSGIASGVIYFRAAGETEWRPLLTRHVGDELQARVDSAAEPAGTHEFRVAAVDVAGNSAETTLRQDGTPMTLEFPLKSGVDLTARLTPGGSRKQKLKYGRSSLAAGVLTTAAGEPIPGADILVDEHFGEGALIRHRPSTVTTDAQGRWSSKLPAGPSRSVTATYAGDQRHLDDEAAVGRLSVATKAGFRQSRKRVTEGRSVKFSGRIGRLGATIPQRGKLLSLQYQEPVSRRWFTVRNPFYTNPRGHYRFRYSFGTHYEVDVAIRFRLRVVAERDWPYRPVRTRARRVIVEAR